MASTVAVLPDCRLPTTDIIGKGRVMFSIHLQGLTLRF
jgi:hypothetical protein